MRILSWIGFCLLIICMPISNGYNILVLFPYTGISHFLVFQPLFKELAHRGHNVTVVSHFPLKNPIENYHDISLFGLSELFIEKVDAPIGEKISPFMTYKTQSKIHNRGLEICENILGVPQVMNLIQTNATKFDLIIQEHFCTDCFLAFNHILKLPQVALSSCTMLPWEFDIMGVPMNPSYNVVNLHTFSDKMSFFERVQNTVAFLVQAYVLPEIAFRSQVNAIVRKHLGDGIPPVEDIARNASVLLINSHFSINRPKPFPPNIIEVSGLHLGEPKELPEGIEKFINESKYGVIYISLGSTVKGSSLSDKYRKMLISVFEKLPQRILWKYENETLPGKPNNVMINRWMPQFDILGHTNVKGFISHCGLLGVIEAVHFGVPIVCIPFFAEQHTNAKLLAVHGGATVLSSETLNEKDLTSAVEFILNSKSRELARLTSKYFHDRPMSPMDTAVWWVEYVARNGGAKAMRSAVLDMPLYQTMLLDVGLFLAIVVFSIAYLSYKISKVILIVVVLLLGKRKKMKTN